MNKISVLIIDDEDTRNIPGRLRTRALRWGAYPLKIRKCEVRATLDADSVLELNLMARLPNNRLWQGRRTFTASQFQNSDAPLRKQCGERALEAQVEITTTSGRPTFRSILVEYTKVGKVEE